MKNGRKGRMRRSLLPLRRIDRKILKRVLGIGAAAFILGYLLTAVLFFRGSDRPAVVSVPDLRELNDGAARERLEDLGLEMQVGDSLPHPQVREGAILAQSPLPGREVAPGTSVRVIVSAGRQRRPVPDVMALTEEPAARLLSAAGFQVQVEQVPDQLPAGRVVSVQPEPGTLVRLPAEVRLQISAGPPLVEVPYLTGLAEEEARELLESIGLRLGEIDYEFGGLESREMVIGQRPPAGDSIRVGEAVDVRILSDRPVGATPEEQRMRNDGPEAR